MATFGKTDIGGSTANTATTYYRVGRYTLSEDATAVSKLTAYCSGSAAAKMCLYKDSDKSLVAITNATVLGGAAWYDFTFSSPPSLTAGDYILGVWSSTNVVTYYNTPAGSGSYETPTLGYDNFEDPLTPASWISRDYSYYATYTPSAGGLSIPVAVHHYNRINKVIRG